MTISPWTIYFWQLADSIKSLTDNIGIISMFLALVPLMLIICSGGEVLEDAHIGATLKKALKLGAIFGVVFSLISAFIPSSKTIAMMVVVPAVVNSEPIQKDLPELYKIGVEALKEQIAPKKP